MFMFFDHGKKSEGNALTSAKQKTYSLYLVVFKSFRDFIGKEGSLEERPHRLAWWGLDPCSAWSSLFGVSPWLALSKSMLMLLTILGVLERLLSFALMFFV